MSRRNIRAIFFDCDGLLVNSELLYLRATQEVLREVGVELTESWFIREQMDKGKSAIERARQAGVSDDGIERLRRRRNDLYSDMLRHEVEPKDGVRETLEKLRGKFVVGVVTSSRKDHLEIILGKTGLRSFFDFLLTADDVAKLKPDPELYLKALELSQQSREHCIALEDSPHGARAAKAANLTCYAIPSVFTKELDFSYADKVLPSMRELPELLDL